MDECESLNSETPELQESSYEALEALSQDDEDEVEELQNRCVHRFVLYLPVLYDPNDYSHG